MTNEQRAKITDLRTLGYGYSKIASMTGLSKDSVKAYCRNHGLGGIRHGEPTDIYNRCLNCGTPLEQKPGVKRKKFCGSECRQTWWNAHQELVGRKAYYDFTCASCGKVFTAYGNSNRKYCSHACYIADRFGREAES